MITSEICIGSTGELLTVYNSKIDGVDADFEHVVGMEFADVKDCSTIAELAALEIQTLASQVSGD